MEAGLSALSDIDDQAFACVLHFLDTEDVRSTACVNQELCAKTRRLAGTQLRLTDEAAPNLAIVTPPFSSCTQVCLKVTGDAMGPANAVLQLQRLARLPLLRKLSIWCDDGLDIVSVVDANECTKMEVWMPPEIRRQLQLAPEGEWQRVQLVTSERLLAYMDIVVMAALQAVRCSMQQPHQQQQHHHQQQQQQLQEQQQQQQLTGPVVANPSTDEGLPRVGSSGTSTTSNSTSSHCASTNGTTTTTTSSSISSRAIGPTASPQLPWPASLKLTGGFPALRSLAVQLYRLSDGPLFMSVVGSLVQLTQLSISWATEAQKGSGTCFGLHTVAYRSSFLNNRGAQANLSKLRQLRELRELSLCLAPESPVAAPAATPGTVPSSSTAEAAAARTSPTTHSIASGCLPPGLTSLTLTSQRQLGNWPSHIKQLSGLKQLHIINVMEPHLVPWQAHPLVLLDELAAASPGLEAFAFSHGAWAPTDCPDPSSLPQSQQGWVRRIHGQTIVPTPALTQLTALTSLDLGGGWGMEVSKAGDWQLLGSCSRLQRLGTLQPWLVPPNPDALQGLAGLRSLAMLVPAYATAGCAMALLEHLPGLQQLKMKEHDGLRMEGTLPEGDLPQHTALTQLEVLSHAPWKQSSHGQLQQLLGCLPRLQRLNLQHLKLRCSLSSLPSGFMAIGSLPLQGLTRLVLSVKEQRVRRHTPAWGVSTDVDRVKPGEVVSALHEGLQLQELVLIGFSSVTPQLFAVDIAQRLRQLTLLEFRACFSSSSGGGGGGGSVADAGGTRAANENGPSSSGNGSSGGGSGGVQQQLEEEGSSSEDFVDAEDDSGMVSCAGEDEQQEEEEEQCGNDGKETGGSVAPVPLTADQRLLAAVAAVRPKLKLVISPLFELC